MKEEGLDQRVIFVAPTTSIQAMLGGDVQFTGAGSSALVSIARGNTPLKVVVATNDRVLQWLVTRPEITSPKELKGKKIATTGVGRRRDVYGETGPYQARSRWQQRRDLSRRRAGQSARGASRRRIRRGGAQRRAALRRSRKGMHEMFFMGNEVKNSWGTLATTDKLIKENPKMVAGFVRATIKALRYCARTRRERSRPWLKFSGVSRQQATRAL